MLARAPDLAVLGSAPTHPAAARVLREGVDVVVVEATADGALDIVADVAVQAPSAKIVVVDVPESEPAVLRLVEAGASAFLTIDASLDDLVSAVHGVEQGESACPPRVTAALLDRLRGLTRERRARGLDADLPRGRDRATDRRRALQQGDRGAPLDRRTDGQEPRPQHPGEAERAPPLRGGRQGLGRAPLPAFARLGLHRPDLDPADSLSRRGALRTIEGSRAARDNR